MYRVFVWVEGMQANFMAQFKEESLAQAQLQNIRSRRKEWQESGKDSITTITGDDYGVFDISTSKIIGAAITYQAEGIQLMPGGRA